jgi:hypothetical protein
MMGAPKREVVRIAVTVCAGIIWIVGYSPESALNEVGVRGVFQASRKIQSHMWAVAERSNAKLVWAEIRELGVICAKERTHTLL